jgi:hypothetical protein
MAGRVTLPLERKDQERLLALEQHCW